MDREVGEICCLYHRRGTENFWLRLLVLCNLYFGNLWAYRHYFTKGLSTKGKMGGITIIESKRSIFLGLGLHIATWRHFIG